MNCVRVKYTGWYEGFSPSRFLQGFKGIWDPRAQVQVLHTYSTRLSISSDMDPLLNSNISIHYFLHCLPQWIVIEPSRSCPLSLVPCWACTSHLLPCWPGNAWGLTYWKPEASQLTRRTAPVMEYRWEPISLDCHSNILMYLKSLPVKAIRQQKVLFSNMELSRWYTSAVWRLVYIIQGLCKCLLIDFND